MHSLVTRSSRLAAVLAALAAASPALATNGMRMIGFGPVQNSMGGASVAAPLDAAVLVTNPAGLAALAPRVDVSGTAFVPTVKYDATWTPDGASLLKASSESDRPTDYIPTLAAVYRVQDALTVGVAALGTAGMGVDHAAGASSVYMSRLFTSYQNMRVAPAVAYRAGPLAVGLAVNLQYAMMSYEAGGQPKHDTAGSLGYGATVGVTYEALPQVTVGAAYETKSTFQDFEFDLASGKQKLTLDQPDVASVGVAVRPVEGLVLALDGQWIHWSLTNGKDLPVVKDAPPGSGWNMSWDDQVVVKVGAQYAATKALKVRAGYDYGKSPLDATRAFENLAFPAIAEHHFTVGAGYDVGNLTIAAAVQYSPESKLSGANTDYGIVGYEATMSQLAFDLGASFRF